MFLPLISMGIAGIGAITGPESLVYIGGKGPGNGKHIVLLAGDEEYRSEEALPQLARILAFRHGFKCTVVFSLNTAGEIDPNTSNNQPGIEAMESADLCVMLLRFRQWPDQQMKSFVSYYLAGKPFIALRTSTHAFNYSDSSQSAFKQYSWQSKSWPGGFGKQVLGETWVSHWGIHGKQATRGLKTNHSVEHPVLLGVGELFGTTDVYEADPPADSEILMAGEVLAGMEIGSGSADGRKKTRAGIEQGLNDPMMPLVWVRKPMNESGKTNMVLTSTFGSATDLLDTSFRRLLVNSAYWMTGLPVDSVIPDESLAIVGEYKPSKFGFEGFNRGVKPGDLSYPLARG